MNQTNMTTRDGIERHFGYAIEQENLESLEANGDEPAVLMQRFRDSFPKFNTDTDPLGLVDIVDQGPVGSCQGQSLAQVFSICYFLATGRKQAFSAMAAYLHSQRYDGLLGRDVGSTLSGGERVATEHGLCVEDDWPYEPVYTGQIKPGLEYPFKLRASKPTKDPNVIREALSLGLPVQIGITWGREMDAEHVENYIGNSGGGHAVVLWLSKLINSWGSWNGDGMSSISDRALDQMAHHRTNTFVIYAPDAMQFPKLDPVSTL